MNTVHRHSKDRSSMLYVWRCLKVTPRAKEREKHLILSSLFNYQELSSVEIPP